MFTEEQVIDLLESILHSDIKVYHFPDGSVDKVDKNSFNEWIDWKVKEIKPSWMVDEEE